MGSRGSFVSTNTGNFTFREGHRLYKCIGRISGVEVLMQTKGSVKAPELSHSPARTYAILQGNIIKHIAYYDQEHHQSACIDFGHTHGGLRPHKHLYLDHKSPASPLNAQDKKLIAKLKRKYKLS